MLQPLSLGELGPLALKTRQPSEALLVTKACSFSYLPEMTDLIASLTELLTTQETGVHPWVYQ